MPLVATKCTNCNREIQLDDTEESGFCLYCGNKVMVREAMQQNNIRFDVILTGVGFNKITVIKVIRQLAPHFDLKEAKDLIDTTPSVIQRGVSYAVAEDSRLRLVNVGAQAEIVAAGAQREILIDTAKNDQVRNKIRGSGKSHIKFWIFWLLVFGLISYWTKYPSFLYEKLIYGEIMDSSLNSDGTVWILTDWSYKFNYSINYVNKTKLMFCKTNLYLYDPIQKTVLKTITTSYDAPPPDRIKLCQDKDRLWQIGPDTVAVYDAKTGEELQNTDSFIGNHKELSPGIANTDFTYFPNTFIIETRDSSKFCYFIDENLIIPDEADLVAQKVYQHYENIKLNSVLALLKESSNSLREKLYSIKGTVPALVDTVMWDHHRFAGLQYGELSSDKEISAVPSSSQDTYLEPLIVYQDQDIAFILSQKQAGAESDRMLTCVDSTGTKKWVVQQDQLFPDLKLTKSNPMPVSALEWILKGERQGNIFVLTFKHFGVLGFDVSSGKKLWELQLTDD